MPPTNRPEVVALSQIAAIEKHHAATINETRHPIHGVSIHLEDHAEVSGERIAAIDRTSDGRDSSPHMTYTDNDSRLSEKSRNTEMLSTGNAPSVSLPMPTAPPSEPMRTAQQAVPSEPSRYVTTQVPRAATEVDSGSLPAGPVHVRLLVWGVTDADQERAIHQAGQGQSRNAWRFVETERLTDAQCPINTRDPDPKSIAAGAGYGWAYIVYPAGSAR